MASTGLVWGGINLKEETARAQFSVGSWGTVSVTLTYSSNFVPMAIKSASTDAYACNPVGIKSSTFNGTNNITLGVFNSRSAGSGYTGTGYLTVTCVGVYK